MEVDAIADIADEQAEAKRKRTQEALVQRVSLTAEVLDDLAILPPPAPRWLGQDSQFVTGALM